MTNYVCISCNNPVDKDGNRSNTAPLLSIESPIPMYGTCCYPDWTYQLNPYAAEFESEEAFMDWLGDQ